MKEWEKIAMSMGLCDDGIPYGVYAYLSHIADLTEKAGGELRSRQVIAAAIVAYEEQKA